MVSCSLYIFNIQLLPLHRYRQNTWRKILTFSVNWCTTTDWYVKVVASTSSRLRICMCVFLERERAKEERKDGKYLLNSVAMLRDDWLYKEEKKERERKIYSATIIHWLSDGKEKVKRNILTLISCSFFYTLIVSLSALTYRDNGKIFRQRCISTFIRLCKSTSRMQFPILFLEKCWNIREKSWITLEIFLEKIH